MKRLALFVGIDVYPGRRRLQCCRADAEILHKEFSPCYDETRLLVDKEVSARSILSAATELQELARPGDMFLFFFSGHGGDCNGERLLGIPNYDVQGRCRGETTLLTSQLSEATAVRGLFRLYILDCCRSTASSSRKGLSQMAFDTPKGGGFVELHSSDAVIPPIILSSSSPGRPSYESTNIGHGYFTKAFLEALRDPSIHNFSDFRNRLDFVISKMNVPEKQLPYFEGPIGAVDLPFWPEWDEVQNPSSNGWPGAGNPSGFDDTGEEDEDPIGDGGEGEGADEIAKETLQEFALMIGNCQWDRAEKMARTLAKTTSVEAQYLLARFFENSPSPNLVSAYKHYKVAAEAGNVRACLRMGQLHRWESGWWRATHGLVAENPQLAFRFFRAAAKREEGDAMCELGLCYRDGYGCKRNLEKAFLWLEKSARLGNEEAVLELKRIQRV